MDTRQYWVHTIETGDTDDQITEYLTYLGSKYYKLVSVEPRGDDRVICILERARDDDPQDTQHEYLVKSFHEGIRDDEFAQRLSADPNHNLVAIVPRDGKLTCFFRLLMPPVFSGFISESE